MGFGVLFQTDISSDHPGSDQREVSAGSRPRASGTETRDNEKNMETTNIVYYWGYIGIITRKWKLL